MPIRQLSPEVVRYIAAGEVVERPASVVKELVENAFDASATSVRVAIQRGGLGAIRVTDDGGGIPADELELAVTRHATSKLATADDLAHVATLGFRGEALASIGAVSHLEIVSRPPDAATGARLRMVGGEITDQGATGGPAGTTITVRNLFYNVPARAAFQKSPTTEARHIITALGALALVRPDVAMSLTNNGRDALQAPGTGDLLDAIAAVYGPEVAGRLVPLPALEERGRAVSGFTALPDEHRANRQYLAFLVNGRWVRSPFLAHAVAEAYRAMLPGGRHPVAVIRLDVPPEDVDVNVHPTKAEVRLRNERLVYGLVQRAIREALTAQDRATVPEWAGWSSDPARHQVARRRRQRPERPEEGKPHPPAPSHPCREGVKVRPHPLGRRSPRRPGPCERKQQSRRNHRCCRTSRSTKIACKYWARSPRRTSSRSVGPASISLTSTVPTSACSTSSYCARWPILPPNPGSAAGNCC